MVPFLLSQEPMGEARCPQSTLQMLQPQKEQGCSGKGPGQATCRSLKEPGLPHACPPDSEWSREAEVDWK